jgi:hypothetical protein
VSISVSLATRQLLTHVDVNLLEALVLQFVKSFEILVCLSLDGIQLPNYEIIIKSHSAPK